MQCQRKFGRKSKVRNPGVLCHGYSASVGCNSDSFYTLCDHSLGVQRFLAGELVFGPSPGLGEELSSENKALPAFLASFFLAPSKPVTGVKVMFIGGGNGPSSDPRGGLIGFTSSSPKGEDEDESRLLMGEGESAPPLLMGEMLKSGPLTGEMGEIGLKLGPWMCEIGVRSVSILFAGILVGVEDFPLADSVEGV